MQHESAPPARSDARHALLVTRNGTKLRLSGSFEHLRELGTIVEEHVVQQLFPMLLERLQGGQQGISDQRQRVLWSEVARLEVTAQTLDFELGQAWGRPVSMFHENIPNGAVLIALVAYSIEEIAGAPTSTAHL